MVNVSSDDDSGNDNCFGFDGGANDEEAGPSSGVRDEEYVFDRYVSVRCTQFKFRLGTIDVLR